MAEDATDSVQEIITNNLGLTKVASLLGWSDEDADEEEEDADEEVYTSQSSTSSSSTSTRTPLDNPNAYNYDCVVDELGWVEDMDNLTSELEVFYLSTGIQPYVYLKSYESSLSSEDDMIDWAEEWYEANIEDEYTFLFVYFAASEDDDGSGYMVYVPGWDILDLMDDDAVDIFWDNLDECWPMDISIDDVLYYTFTCTAYDMMH